jgi:hypothetical protein
VPSKLVEQAKVERFARAMVVPSAEEFLLEGSHANGVRKLIIFLSRRLFLDEFAARKFLVLFNVDASADERSGHAQYLGVPRRPGFFFDSTLTRSTPPTAQITAATNHILFHRPNSRQLQPMPTQRHDSTSVALNPQLQFVETMSAGRAGRRATTNLT